MIWYLLYPLRGTTEPPYLPPAHPIRRAFQAYGTATARHWLLSILLTVVVSVLLCYPALFQTDSPAATALRNLPKHVWTSTTEVEGDRLADVEVRQVWVHGDHMKAIDRRVLREAMHVQGALIGNGFDNPDPITRNACAATRPGQKWGFHSPLMYWNCSQGMLDDDPDLLATINSHAGVRSALNLTLRPSTVFAGKAFTKAKLRSADALVITLFDQTSQGLGQDWNARSKLLAQEMSTEWSMFPQDGQTSKSHLYEFRFKPMTLIDDLFLAASYMVTAGYVIMRMMQLRAVKSWFGLLVTICAKMAVCVLGSFTICSFLGINLAHIPRPWIPGVVFCFGLGNIFRVINAVLETPPQMPSPLRVGHAIGEVGHLSLAVAGQNLVLIYFCSRIVTPWVADFCIFAAVTLILDLVFHLTFFLAVLSVDVQRMELSDSLQRVDMSQAASARNGSKDRQSWLSALRHGTLPVSTRFAGSVAIFSIILAINWHFFDSSDRKLSVQTVKDRLLRRHTKIQSASMWTAPPINQARTPGDWLRLQDHNTAKELFGFIKPDAHSFIARIYDPLLVVLKDAKGRDVTRTPLSLVGVLRHFAQGHAYSAALIVAFLIAGVTLFMNYLLWTGLPEGFEENGSEEDTLTVETLPAPQTLDIVRLVASPRGHVASISLDRTTSVWLREHDGFKSSLLQTAAMNPKIWPIVAGAIDDGGNLLALCSEDGVIGLWSLAAARFSTVQTVDIRAQTPILFMFATIRGSDGDVLVLFIVTPDGYLIEFEARGGIQHTRRICTRSIVCARLHFSLKGDLSLVFVSKTGEVHILPLNGDQDETSEVVAGLDPGPPPGSNPSKIRCVEAVPALGLIFALRDEEAEMFDFDSRVLIHAFHIGHVKPHSFRVMHSALRNCTCGAPAVHSLCVAYTEEKTDHLVMQIFTIDDTLTSLICLGKQSDNDAHNCVGFSRAKDVVHIVEPSGAWEAMKSLGIIGLRKCTSSPTPSSVASNLDYEPPEPSALVLALQQRAVRHDMPPTKAPTSTTPLHIRHQPSPHDDSDSWEVWTLSLAGEFRSRPLESTPSTDTDGLLGDDQLFVAAAGPIAKIGKKSVAVGFGNTVKIISAGKETFDGMNGPLDLGVGSFKSRVRRAPVRKMQ